MNNPPNSLQKAKKPAENIVELPREDTDSHMGSLPARRKHTFGVLASPSPGLEESGFEFNRSLSPEAEKGTEPRHAFGMMDKLSPSPELGDDSFDMYAETPPESEEESEPQHDVEMLRNMSSSPKEEHGDHLAPPAKKCNFGLRMPPSPVQKDGSQLSPKKSDFGILSSLSPSPEPQADIGEDAAQAVSTLSQAKNNVIGQPTVREEGLGTSSEDRVWKWGCPVPSPIRSKQHSVVEEVEGVGELGSIDCQKVQMLQEIHRRLSDLHKKQSKANDILEEMITDL